MKRIFSLLLLTGLVLLVGCGKKNSKMIQVKGSDTILNLSQAVVEEYMKSNPSAKISVTGGGSGTGIAAILNKTVHIAMASRDIKEKELKKAKDAGMDIEEVTIGYDGITVIINKENKISNLSQANLRKIFIGEITNWKELGGEDEKIIVISRDSSSGTHSFFKEFVLRKGNKKNKEEYSDKALFLPSNEALKQEVKSSKGAIAYIGLGYIDDTVKTISVDGVEANVKNVASKKYPISRAVFWYIDKESSIEVRNLIGFMLSKEGQKIVEKEGFVPVK